MAQTAYAPLSLASGGHEFRSHPFVGLDLRADPKYLAPGALLEAKNLVPYQPGALSKRRGCAYLNSTAWTSVLGVPFALRYYVNSSTRKKLVVTQLAAGVSIGSVNDTTGALTALTG